MIEVAAIYLEQAIAVMEDGQTITITDWFDDEGDECSPEEATGAVAGPLASGQWVAIALSAFAEIKLH